jgi:hypothetical protein
MRATLLTATCLCLAAPPALGATGGHSRTLRTNGVTVHYPATWQATTRPLSLVTAPGQLLAVASFAFPAAPRPDGCEPAGTFAAIPSDGALIVVLYYGKNLDNARFPRRPSQFRLGSARRYECFGARPSYSILFKQANRYFQIMVAFGNRATPRTRATVLSVLDSLAAT